MLKLSGRCSTLNLRLIRPLFIFLIVVCVWTPMVYSNNVLPQEIDKEVENAKVVRKFIAKN